MYIYYGDTIRINDNYHGANLLRCRYATVTSHFMRSDIYVQVRVKLIGGMSRPALLCPHELEEIPQLD